jgi:integrase
MQNDDGAELEERARPLPVAGRGRDYGDCLARAGRVADRYIRATAFSSYQETIALGTQQAQLRDLALFSRFLTQVSEETGIELRRTAEELYNDPAAWTGMTASLLTGFRRWLLYNQPRAQGEEKARGYRITSVSRRMSTVRQYCRLANLCGTIAGDEWTRIESVKGDTRAAGDNIDADRERKGIEPRIKDRKERATPVSWEEFKRLMHTTTGHTAYRDHDEILAERDTLLVCLLGEHGLRVGEVVALNIGSIDLRSGELFIKRSKTHDFDALPLLDATREAAELYLGLLFREGGSEHSRNLPLFLGYEGKRITRQGMYKRVHELGLLIGIPTLSPHDLRHYFAKNAFALGNPINRVKHYGGWRSGHTPLRYAELYGQEAGKLIVDPEKDAGAKE